MSITPHTVLRDRSFEGPSGSLEVRSWLTPARNFVRAKFTDIDFSDCNSERMCFTYCVFVGCKFVETIFDKLDLESCTFISCTIEDASFVQCDMKSCKWIECRWQRAIFDQSLLNRCEFESISAVSCSLKQLYMIENEFRGCEFRDVDSTQITSTLNEYVRCHFHKFKFTDGTFAFQVFWECEFDECVIGWATIGISYGLSNENLKGLGLVHYFTSISVDEPEDLVQFIIEQFREAGNSYRLLVTSINFGSKKYLSISYLIDLIIENGKSEETNVRHEEVLFFRLIIKYESDYNNFPVAILKNLIDRIESAEFSKWNDIFYIKNYLLYLESARIQEILKQEFSLNGGEVIITIKYSEKPKITLMQLVMSEDFLSHLRNQVIQYDEYSGSYIEMFVSTAALLTSLRLILSLLVGNAELINKLLLNIRSIRENFKELGGNKKKVVVSSGGEYEKSLYQMTYSLGSFESKNLCSISDEFTSKLISIDVEKKSAIE